MIDHFRRVNPRSARQAHAAKHTSLRVKDPYLRALAYVTASRHGRSDVQPRGLIRPPAFAPRECDARTKDGKPLASGTPVKILEVHANVLIVEQID